VAIQYQRDDERRRIAITTDAHVKLEDLISIIERQAAEGAWRYGILYDARARANDPTMEQVHQLVLRVGTLTTSRGPRGPVAIVTTNPRLFKMSRAYATLGKLTALDAAVFTTIAEAEQWLEQQQPDVAKQGLAD
jgi:hypothetical protein